MPAERIYNELEKYKKALLVVLGIVGTLLFTALIGDTRFYPGDAPCGWFGLWFLTTVACIPLGIVMLFGNWWREIPLEDRRRTAMGYLLVGFINFISLAFLTRWYSIASYAFTIPLTVGYGIILLIITTRLNIVVKEEKEELFP